MNDLVPVLVDDRERRSGPAELLEASEHFAVRYERLPVGDYLVDDRFLFERKTFPDLVLSIQSGRLFRQALRLAETDRGRPALLLEGTKGDLADSGMRWEAVQGALITVSLLIGLPLLRTRTPEETLKTFLYAARQGRSLALGALPRRGRRPRGKAALQRHILQGLPGIGPERAARLIRRFENVRAVVSAEEEELASVEGVGPHTARRILWAVKERGIRYGGSAHRPVDHRSPLFGHENPHL